MYIYIYILLVYDRIVMVIARSPLAQEVGAGQAEGVLQGSRG